MVHYKLKYNNARGLGETARQIFLLAGQDYEDVRITPEEFQPMKHETPFGQLPVLEVDGQQLAQSYAINRYLANKFGFSGKSDWERGQIDSYAEQYKDFYTEAKQYLWTLSGSLQGDLVQLKKTQWDPAVQKHFTIFNNIIKANPNGYLVGDSFSYMDLTIADLVDWLLSKNIDLSNYPEIIAMKDRIQSIPVLRKWIQSRPVTPY